MRWHHKSERAKTRTQISASWIHQNQINEYWQRRREDNSGPFKWRWKKIIFFCIRNSEMGADCGLHTINNTLCYSTMIMIIIMRFNRRIFALIPNLNSEEEQRNFQIHFLFRFSQRLNHIKGKETLPIEPRITNGFSSLAFVFVWNKHHQDLSLCDFVCFLTIIIFSSVFSSDKSFFSVVCASFVRFQIHMKRQNHEHRM